MGQFYITTPDSTLDGGRYTGALYARMLHEDGRPYHTFRTYTMLVEADGVHLKNLTIENTAGPGKEVGQAIALYIDADQVHVEDCILHGYQDTLFLAPLPPKEKEVDGFLGPKQFTPRRPITVYFKNCLIEGGVDFIFGGATAYFDNCEFRNVEPGYVFAPSTPEEVDTGFVARNCRFTAAEGVPDGSCYIGRPWREFAKVRLENCWLGSHICDEGWHDWNKPEAHATVRFEEIGSQGPGAAHPCRPEWVSFR